ncbi:helix-turn-helix transcriptional regulator [uncultured Rhodoblastus sp.]|uniref:helix-turn-helix domain-containing protein n=1 Tax=uncultured Rhodoblastus sp. TaxID=543037 RepID=UPI0025E28FE5|nr:helix-turn-helix transcriptional regulator [uncultured Rhodoblastus sp.]
MAKTMLTPEIGALDKVLKAHNKSRVDLAGALGMSRGTLKKIADGVSTKDQTLKRVAMHLKIPVDHLIMTPKLEVVPSENPSGIQCGINDSGFEQLEMRQLDAFQFAILLDSGPELIWNLNVNNIDATVSDLLKKLEENVNIVNCRQRDNFQSEKNKCEAMPPLALQIEEKQSLNKIEIIINELKLKGIYIYGNNYMYWSRDQEREFSCLGEGAMVYKFHSDYKFLIFIDNRNVNVFHREVYIGSAPPKKVPWDGGRVMINGKHAELVEQDDNFPF